MTRDDATVGHLLSRREILAMVGATGALWVARASATESLTRCVVRPQQTEGPYFVDGRLNRRDIRSDPASGNVRPGKRLDVTILVLRLSGGSCEPLQDAQVDLWHCDANGSYSDVHDRQSATVGQMFLRGHQTTDQRGAARFITIFPGWYPGRTVHIHFKIRTKSSQARTLDFTSQLYFDDALTDLVHAEAPYASSGRRRTRNQNDGIFRRGGNQLVLDVTKNAGTLAGTFELAMQF